MSELQSQNWLLLDGTPVPSATAPQLIVQGTLTSRQRAAVVQEYQVFARRRTVAVCERLVSHRTLSDGTRVMMESMQGKDRVMVWPAKSDPSDGPVFVAVPVYEDLGFAPIFERPTINLPGVTKPPYPEEPEFDVPMPERQHAARPRVQFMRKRGPLFSFPDDSGTYRNTTYESRITYEDQAAAVFTVTGSYVHTAPFMRLETDVPQVAITLADESDPDKFWSPLLNSAGSGPDDIASGTRLTFVTGSVYRIWSMSAPAFTGATTYYKDFVPSGGTGIPVTLNTSLYDEFQSLGASADSLDATYAAAYDAAIAAWQAQHQAWLDGEYQDWLDECAEIDAMYPSLGPYPNLANLRAAAREAQLTALRAWLDKGVGGHPHLAARFMELPWNIGTKPGGTAPAPGTVAATGPSNDGGELNRFLTFTASSATREAVVPDPIGGDPVDLAQFGRDPAHPLGRDFAMPRALFGWVANGTYRRYAANRAFHNAEPPEIRPHDLNTLGLAVQAGYDQFLAKGVVRATTNASRINSDGYVPPGVRLTIVHFEYEIFDVFTGQWVWSPSFGIRRFDSMWLVSLGLYEQPTLPVPPADADRPRKVRIRKVQTQQRKSDMTWSTPETVPANKLKDNGVWVKDVTVGTGTNPCCVVILEGLPPTALPISGALPTPMWSGEIRRIKDVLKQPWDGNLNTPPLVAHAVGITKKA